MMEPGGQHAGISATPAAREAVIRLRAARGHPLMFVQSGGCCAGSTPMCFPAGEFIVGSVDLLLGEIEGAPFYIDSRLHAAWNKAELIPDVVQGIRRDSRLARVAECTSWCDQDHAPRQVKPHS